MYAKLAFGNMRRSLKDYGVYFATLVIGVCMFYAFNSITQQAAVLDLSSSLDSIMQMLSEAIGGVSVFLAVIMGFLVVYANRFLIRRRKKEFAIYLTLGMERSQVSRIIVLETLLVGLVSLGVGLLLGYLLSQLLLVVTASMFSVKMTGFKFFFSPQAALITIACFGLIFLVALVFNIGTVSRCKLIDLIAANRKNESAKLRSLPLSIALTVISLACIGVAYWLLHSTGFSHGITPAFRIATVLVIAGTFLFFFSFSGVLLRIGQANRKHYLRGLNMFTLRQLNSRINTAWISISLVCIVLFLALTSTCGGFSIVSAFNTSIEKATYYDATCSEFFGYQTSAHAESQQEAGEEGPTEKAAAADGYDMAKAFARDVPEWSQLVSASAQVSYYEGDFTYQTLFDRTDYNFSQTSIKDSFYATPLDVVPVSQLNAVRALQGLSPVELGSDQYLIWSDYDEMKGFWAAYLQQNGSNPLEVYGKKLTATGAIDSTVIETSSTLFNTGIIVVPDDVIPADAHIRRTLLDIMYAGPREEVEPKFRAAIEAAYPSDAISIDDSTSSWPYYRMETALDMQAQSVGLTALVSYLAIYIGIILIITCAAILALQQLSEAADNTSRYALIEKLGAEQKMVDHALYRQIGIYFIFPLVLALAHSAVAMNEVSATVAILGHYNIAGPLAITALIAMLFYGGYYLITCSISKNMIRPGKMMRTG